MRTTLLLTFALCCTIAAQASYIPNAFDGIRAAIVDRQVTISNAPPFDAAAKKQLNALKVALKTIDKPSTSLKSDLTALGKVVAGINKGASNEILSFEFASAISNYVAVLNSTNGVLVEAVADADNNPKLKDKALDLLAAAQNALAVVDPATDLNGSAKSLGGALKKYLAAAKAVAAAVNAKPVPLPNPKGGTLVIEVNGQFYTFGAQFPLRNDGGTGLVGTGVANNSSSTLIIHIDDSEGPGTYGWGLIASDTVDGHTISIAGGDGATGAQVTAASSSVLVGTFEGVAQVTYDGVVTQNVPIKGRFSGKKFSFF